MDKDNVLIAKRVLLEWARAIRGDWGSIDGRSCRSQIEAIASAMTQDEPLDIERLREFAGICISGNAHWQWFCEEDCKEYDWSV